MDKLLAFATADPKDRRKNGGDSLSDQLSSVHTFYFLVGFAVVVQFGNMFGDKISCWVPAHFTGSHRSYADNVCWTTSTYYLPFNDTNNDIPTEGEDRRKIGYYQWVALILIFQAALFYIPRPLWRGLSKRSGIAVSTITDAAIDCMDQRNKEGRDKSIDYMVRHMSRFLLEIQLIHRASHSRFYKKCVWEIYGWYLSIAYIFMKCVYLANVIGQFFLLNRFLDTKFDNFGVRIIEKMRQNQEWTDASRFPRVALCDFKIRILGNIHRYTVQCALPLNLFNEIIFIFFWFWFVVVAIVTGLSLLSWIITLAIPKINQTFIKARLVALEKIDQTGKIITDAPERTTLSETKTQEDKEGSDDDNRKDIKEINTEDSPNFEEKREITMKTFDSTGKTVKLEKPNHRHFVRTFLRKDGCFLIHMIKKNSSDLIAAEVIAGLWGVYVESYRKFKGFKNTANPSEEEPLLRGHTTSQA